LRVVYSLQKLTTAHNRP